MILHFFLILNQNYNDPGQNHVPPSVSARCNIDHNPKGLTSRDGTGADSSQRHAVNGLVTQNVENVDIRLDAARFLLHSPLTE